MYKLSSYTTAKEIFGDIYDDYVDYNTSVIAYKKLVEILNKPIKLVLLYGKPGTGKTFLLNKIYKDLHKKKPIIFIPTPFFDESEFVKYLYENSFGKMDTVVKSFDEFFQVLSKKVPKQPISVFVDEAQMYPPNIVEKIRLLADTRKYKFIFTVHKTDEQEDIFAKDYFKTRIWESVELKNIPFDEFTIYVEKKFLYHNMFEYIDKFSKKQYKTLYNVSNGNLREINKIFYKIFEICEYFDMNEPNKINPKHINQKFIEMAFITLGYIDA